MACFHRPAQSLYRGICVMRIKTRDCKLYTENLKSLVMHSSNRPWSGNIRGWTNFECTCLCDTWLVTYRIVERHSISQTMIVRHETRKRGWSRIQLLNAASLHIIQSFKLFYNIHAWLTCKRKLTADRSSQTRYLKGTKEPTTSEGRLHKVHDVLRQYWSRVSIKFRVRRIRSSDLSRAHVLSGKMLDSDYFGKFTDVEGDTVWSLTHY